MKNRCYWNFSKKQERSAKRSCVLKTKGEISVHIQKNLMVLRWKDMKDVYIMSTVHGPDMATITARGGIQKQKPKACIDYKDIMKGVDLMDQFLATTNCARSHLKYYRKIYLRFLDIRVS